jgi:exodeoxyribonuclease-3
MNLLPGVDESQKRFLAVTVGDVRVVNVYVPNGESVGSPKYVYKLGWLQALSAHIAEELKRYPKLVIVGDFNIAPEDQDVHDPKRWEGKVLCSEPERAALGTLMNTGLIDTFRRFPQPEKSFTWWDYRLNGFARNWGLRIDHILGSSAFADACRSCRIDLEPRRHERPSDHTPVVAEIA